MGKKVKLRESSEKESKLVRITRAPSQEELMPSEEEKRLYAIWDKAINNPSDDFILRGLSPSEAYRIYGPVWMAD